MDAFDAAKSPETAAPAPETPAAKVSPAPRKRGGMTAAETAYMRGGATLQAGSIPHSTSRYLNSPLFVHAFAQKSLRRNGRDVPMTYDIPDMSRGLDDVQDFEEAQGFIELEKARNPEFAAWLARRRMTIYDPANLKHYAPGTLGATIRAFMEKSGYDLNFMNKGVTPINDIEYMMVRNSTAHDIHHLATGFGPNPPGEQALALMNIAGNAVHFNPGLAQFLSLPNIFVTAGMYMRTSLHYTASLPLLYEATRLGTLAGESLKKPLIMVDWEDYLDWRLDDIAKDLGFTRGPGDAWADTEHLFRD